MPHRKPRTLIMRIMLALIFTFGGVASLTIATQSSARAASCTATYSSATGEWWVPYGCNGVPIPGSHKCYEIGYIVETGGTTDAIECADIVATNTSSATQVWGEGEFYCQGEYPRCQGMNVSVDFSYTDQSLSGTVGGATTVPVRNYKCNPTIGACPNGGRALVSTAHGNAPYGDCQATYSWDPYDGWHGAPQVISITPGGYAFHSVAELDSNHVTVCFS